jgi:uncharacterized membrane protein YagU involved in acid resistance
MGALYGAGAAYAPTLRAGHGVMYGLLVWVGSVEIALPITGLSDAPTKYSSGEHFFSALSHAVFGFVMETTRRPLDSLAE